MADGRVIIDTALNNKGFERGLRGLKGGLGGLSGVVSNLARTIGLAFGTAVLINFGRQSVEAASSLSSALIGLQSIMEGQGRSFSQAQGFIQSYIKDGLIPMQDAVTAYKNLAMRGYDTTQIERTMLALKDASAFGRQASLTMGKAVSSATEGLKNENSILVDNSGVTKNVSMMWKDYADKLGVGVQSLTKAQKIEAEVNGILEETRYQTGDAAKVAGTYAGQVSMLSFQFQQLKVAVGEAIIPVAKVILPAVNAVILSLTTLATTMGQVTTALFGKTQEGAEGTSSAIQGGVENQEDLTGAIEKTQKAQKKSLATFDEINKLTTDTANAASSSEAEAEKPAGPSGAGLVPELSEGVLALADSLKRTCSELADFAGRIWAVFAESWAQNGQRVITAARGAFSGILELIQAVSGAFADVWTNGTGLTLLNTIHSIIAGVLDVVTALAERFRIAWEASGNGQAIWQSLLNLFQLALGFVDRIVSATVTWAHGLNLEPIVSAFRRLMETLEPFVALILDRLAWAYEQVLLPLASWAIEAAGPAAIDALAECIGVLTEIIQALEPLGIWLWDHFLQPIAEWTGGVIVSVLHGVADGLGRLSDWISAHQTAVQAMTLLIAAFFAELVASKFISYIPQIIGLLQQFAMALLSIDLAAIGTKLSIALLFAGFVMLASVWSKMSTLGKVATVLSVLAAAATTAAIAIGVFHASASMGLAAAGIVAGIVAITAAVIAANKSASQVKPVSAGNSARYGTSSSALQGYSIPHLARGAVIPANREFLAVLGDQRSGTNIEAPLSTIEEAARRAVAQELDRRGGMTDSSPTGDIILEIGGEQFARIIQPFLTRENRRIGTRLVKGVGF